MSNKEICPVSPDGSQGAGQESIPPDPQLTEKQTPPKIRSAAGNYHYSIFDGDIIYYRWSPIPHEDVYKPRKTEDK